MSHSPTPALTITRDYSENEDIFQNRLDELLSKSPIFDRSPSSPKNREMLSAGTSPPSTYVQMDDATIPRTLRQSTSVDLAGGISVDGQNESKVRMMTPRKYNEFPGSKFRCSVPRLAAAIHQCTCILNWRGLMKQSN